MTTTIPDPLAPLAAYLSDIDQRLVIVESVVNLEDVGSLQEEVITLRQAQTLLKEEVDLLSANMAGLTEFMNNFRELINAMYPPPPA